MSSAVTRDGRFGFEYVLARAGGSASANVCDIREEEAVKSAVAQVLAAHGRIDGLLNNAGGQYSNYTVRDLAETGANATSLCRPRNAPFSKILACGDGGEWGQEEPSLPSYQDTKELGAALAKVW